ncbi:hypothetical protein [Cohnella sp. JJ-181]|uniref:hypothetical protein n=1 Tax=Cohnella rhizoplanae TaxID=2974897 RepID=UPI0022FF5795|nr:hypothetical protein [Cohnella sp. JJ-181]CAI6034691.1 hypothetical protein COHCIP112018_00845 [Cohnella sp. JJ-181]
MNRRVRKKEPKLYVFIIKGSTVKKFILIDILLGTGFYYAIKLVYASAIVATAGSVIGTEGIKRIRK